jgi:hypothetical protein
MQSIDERLESTAEPWKPEFGDKIVGTVVDVDSRTTEYGTYPIVVLETDAGDEIAVHGFHTVLKNEFAKRPPTLGERIGVKYLGKSDKGYEAYRVVFAKRVEPDWRQIRAEAEAEIGNSSDPADDDEEPANGATDDGIPF